MKLVESLFAKAKLIAKDQDPQQAVRDADYTSIIIASLDLITNSKVLENDILNEVLLALIVYSAPQESWSSADISKACSNLLEKFESHYSSSDFMVKFVLQSFIRPLFAQRHRHVTPAARKIMSDNLPAPRLTVDQVDDKSQAWKSEKPYSLSVLAWVMQHINVGCKLGAFTTRLTNVARTHAREFSSFGAAVVDIVG